MSANLGVKAVDPDLFEAIDPTVYFDPDLFDLGPLANPYLEDSEEEQLFIEASKTTESQEQLFVDASKTTESQEQQKPRKFGPPVGQEYLKSLRDRAVPQRTRNQTKWAVQRWRDWVTDRNRHGL